jgi:hypothetical protein
MGDPAENTLQYTEGTQPLRLPTLERRLSL